MHRLAWLYILLCLLWSVAGLGRWRPDEHFSILEFLGYKLGATPWEFLHYPNSLSDLPWEYPEKIRPFAEVMLFYVIAKILSVVTQNPVVLEIFFRLIAIVLSLIMIRMMVARYHRENDERRTIVYAVFACGFLPFLYSRLMSETWGAIVLTMGILLYLHRKENRHQFLAGVLIGTGFWLRCHIGFMIAGFGFWVLFIERPSWKNILVVSAGFAVACAINVVIDRWGYGVWTFTPWNYFNTGVVQDRASAYGVSPVWYYPILIWNEMGPGTLLAFIVALVYWICFPRSVFTWMGFFFFFGHTIVPRKEARFLIPLFFLTPLYLAELVNKFASQSASITRYLKYAAICGLVYVGLAGIERGLTRNELRFYYTYYSSPVAREPLYMLSQEEGPFQWGGYYYRPAGYREEKFKSYEEFLKKLDSNSRFLFNTTFDFPPVLKAYCHLAVQTVPMWLDKININHWVDRTSFWQVYNCKK